MNETSGPASDEAAAAHSDENPEGVPCLWFFLPLPHPLPLPDKWMSQRYASPHDVAANDAPLVRSSLLIHQASPSVDPMLTSMSDLWRLATATMAGKQAEPLPAPLKDLLEADGIDTSPIGSARTVAEVAVTGFAGDDEDTVLKALDIALDHARFVQRSVAHVTQGPVRLIARSTLPPFVPTFAGAAFSVPADSDRATWPKPRVDNSVMYMVPDCAPPATLGLASEYFDDAELRRVNQAAEYVARAAAFQTYADMRREAMVQRAFDGNFRMAVVALATSGEVFLDTMLLHLLWEERTDPAEAATYFDRSEGHVARIRKNFPNRVGGSWDPDTNSAPGRYQRDLVRLRHRVVHAGHEPSPEELERAWTVLFDLEKYVGDRLVAGKNLKKYTRTAMAWMAQDGIRRRGRWTKFVETLTNDSREPNWKDAFIRWRHHVDRALDAAAPTPGADVTALVLYADKASDSSIRWVIHDPATAYATTIADPRSACSADVVENITAWLMAADSGDAGENRVSAPVDRLPNGLAWRRDDYVFPELVIFPGPMPGR